MSVVDAALRAWCAADPHPIVIAERDLSVRWANDAARHSLVAGQALVIDDFTLVAFSRPEADRLNAFLATFAGGFATHVIVAAPPAYNLVLRISSVEVEGTTLYPIIVREAAPASRLGLDSALTALNLTRAESRIVELMVVGEALESIAQQTGSSVDTVRTHVRNLYAKLGVSSRPELHATLANYIWL